MSYCKNCGAQKADHASFCPNCGARDAGAQARNFVNNVNNTDDFTHQMDARDIAENKCMAVFAYISWMILIPIFFATKSPFARFHVNQALPLVLITTALSIFGGVLSFLLWPLGILFWLADMAICVLLILGIINAVNGRAKELPFTGKFRFFK